MKRIVFVSVTLIILVACGAPSGTPAPPTQGLPATDIPQTAIGPSSTPAPPATVASTAGGSADATSFPDPSAYKWAPIVSGLASPVDIQFPDDGSGRMFVLEQAGRMRVVKDGQSAQTPYLDIRDKVGSSGNEQGLLGLTFHPNFANNPFFYINYTDTNGDTVIARFQAGGEAADPASQKDLIHVDQPFQNHNGGVLTFGPDGFLYAGLGDGGSAGDPHGNGQNRDVLLGKILRIDVDHGDPYALPADNPFGSEVWAYGLRNPWRISFDRLTGDLYIADVGQNTWEEVNFLKAGSPGGNFGWNYFEASDHFQGQPPPDLQLIFPVAEYNHSAGRCSITGGYVYRGAMPDWQGIYLYGDYCAGKIWGMLPSTDPSSKTGWDSKVLFDTGGNITSFGQDPSGEIYYADRAGVIYQLQQ